MYLTPETIAGQLDAYRMAEVSMRYSSFVPRLYNLALELGFERGRIMPSRAFCSDESQGYPIILIAKHFGTFPFNHGQVGGIVATDRHAPHAHHGRDLIIIQASHVGYDPHTQRFGTYRRLQTEHHDETTSCGKICGVLDWYLREYAFAQDNILLREEDGNKQIVIDNQLLHAERREGLILRLERLTAPDTDGRAATQACLSTAKIFPAHPDLVRDLGDYHWPQGRGAAIGKHLGPELFFFRRETSGHTEDRNHLERNLLNVMPFVVTSRWPALTAAQANIQVEFDRAFRTIVQEPAYRGKRLLFVSGLNVDISPSEGQLFPLTKFICWAAHLQAPDGSHQTWEQPELHARLKAQPTTNPDQVDLEQAIAQMESAREIQLLS